MTVTIERRDQIAIVTLDRPEKKNAISWDMRRELFEAFEGFDEDEGIRAVILTGKGTDFCSGMDVGEFGARGMNERFCRTGRLHRISRAIYRLKKPTIAAVRGVCMGAGWSYALCCDFIIAAKDARFGQVFNRTGLAPDAASVWLLAQHVGAMQAKELCYTGRVIDADEAVRLGLALRAVEGGEVMNAALEMGASLASGPSLSLALTKRQFEVAATASFDTFLEAEFSMPSLMQVTEDHAEGVAAFRDRRAPVFRGA
jgi:2-(1,2-epoxy-1,2-dihydrophenyl)acetyl-CoA isomerase